MEENSNIYRPQQSDNSPHYVVGDDAGKSGGALPIGVLVKIIVSIAFTTIGCVLIPLKNFIPALNAYYVFLLLGGFLLCDIALGLAIRSYLQILSRPEQEDDVYNNNLTTIKKLALIWMICSIIITAGVTVLFAVLFGEYGIRSVVDWLKSLKG